MGSSQHRASANTGRKTHASASRLPAQDNEERLLENFKNANTELNKVMSDRDRYKSLYEQVVLDRDRFKSLYEQATHKLSESHEARQDLDSQLHAVKEDKSKLQAVREDKAKLQQKIQELERSYDELVYDYESLSQHYTTMEQRYTEAAAQLHSAGSTHAAVQAMPVRPKPSTRSPGRKDHKDERVKRSDNESRAHKAEKERLSRRFDEKRPAASRDRRHSFIEPWGPSAGAGAAVAGRGFADVQAPAVPPSHSNAVFSSVPRTANALNPGLYPPSAGSLYNNNSDGYEDGNYHAYPVAR
ncbi:hypothetical protein CDD83_10529 [Cordyceps sp. RAO-2017]|nr:hypothetical protein CDD83_10529 [Cordyceps sp. RAO-2017]